MLLPFQLSFLIVVFLRFASASDDEYRLLQDLKDRYDPVERPVFNHSDAVKVSFRLYLQQIVDVDEKNQVLTIVIWEEFRWSDYKMVWDPREYGGIDRIRLPSSTLWKPDVILFNSADENFDARFAVNFVVDHDGSILQTPPAIIKSSCQIDITWFPFDEQMCLLKFGSWSHTRNSLDLCVNGTSLDMVKDSIDLGYYVHNGEWEVIATPVKKVLPPYGDSNDFYVELHFFIHIRRKTIYYGMNWIVPSVLFLLSNVLGFTMPAECGEKITLQTTNLLSVTVFLGMVADITPPTSTSVPIIAAFFSISMVILGSSIIFTLLIINVHFRSPRTHKMSPWVRTIFLEWLPWLLLMNRPGKQFKKPKRKRRRALAARVPLRTAPAQCHQRVFPAQLCTSESTTSRSTLVGTRSLAAEKYMLLHAETTEPFDAFLDIGTVELLRGTLRELSDFLLLSQQKMEEEEEEEEAKADWRFMAMSLDRACLFFYGFICCALPLWIFAVTPAASNVTSEAMDKSAFCESPPFAV
ncbi:hypothetical protein niasHT_022622 [Heterodera trifolii]|uniref:Uncharacterized protein n=1 Tax=Heterodera trifolii TaxID=157864 RepID=A0ABD2JRG9_9BILA